MSAVPQNRCLSQSKRVANSASVGVSRGGGIPRGICSNCSKPFFRWRYSGPIIGRHWDRGIPAHLVEGSPKQEDDAVRARTGLPFLASPLGTPLRSVGIGFPALRICEQQRMARHDEGGDRPALNKGGEELRRAIKLLYFVTKGHLILSARHRCARLL
jgi:hypothetical protein